MSAKPCSPSPGSRTKAPNDSAEDEISAAGWLSCLITRVRCGAGGACLIMFSISSSRHVGFVSSLLWKLCFKTCNTLSAWSPTICKSDQCVELCFALQSIDIAYAGLASTLDPVPSCCSSNLTRSSWWFDLETGSTVNGTGYSCIVYVSLVPSMEPSSFKDAMINLLNRRKSAAADGGITIIVHSI